MDGMIYPEELIEEIRIQNNIVDLISQYVRLTKKGSSHFGLCPFHNEKTPSFSVVEEKQIYHCFGCGVGGNVITFVMEYENYSFLEALKYLADRAHINLPEPEVNEEMRKAMRYKQTLYDANKEAARYFYYSLNSEQGIKAFEYLQGRGVDPEIRKKFGVGYSQFFRDDLLQYMKEKGFKESVLKDAGLVLEDKDKPGNFFDRFFNRLMFPIFDIHNRVIGFGGRVLGDGMPKYLNSPETKLFDKGKNLYGLNIARTTRRGYLILVEGYMDVISLHQAGFDNAVASLGTALTTGQSHLLKRYTETVIIAYDGDQAGKNAALKAISVVEAAGISTRILQMKKYKDPDEVIKMEGKDAFEELIQSAIPSFMFQLEQLETQYNLNDPEDRSKFYQSIAKKLVQLENEIKRESYLEAVLEKYKIKPKALEVEMEKIGKDVGIAANNREERVYTKDQLDKNKFDKNKDSIMLAQKNILTFMTSHQDIFLAVKQYLNPNEFVDELYMGVAKTIFALYEKDSEIQPASIINQFIELEDQKKAAQIFNNNIQVDNQVQFEKIINENLQIIKMANIDKKSQTITDVKDLQELIKLKRDLQDLYISLNHG